MPKPTQLPKILSKSVLSELHFFFWKNSYELFYWDRNTIRYEKNLIEIVKPYICIIDFIVNIWRRKNTILKIMN
jgi:hypothetical protein